jgi:MinD superfamily P-loop ATPase
LKDETITIIDVDDEFINDTIILDNEERKFISMTKAEGITCPHCKESDERNLLYQMDNGEYFYIGYCCGKFSICEVNGEDNGLATE